MNRRVVFWGVLILIALILSSCVGYGSYGYHDYPYGTGSFHYRYDYDDYPYRYHDRHYHDWDNHPSPWR